MKKNAQAAQVGKQVPTIKPFRFIIYLLLAAALVALDQLSKNWVLGNPVLMAPGGEIQVIPNFFSLRYTFNTGAAFSFLAQQAWGISVLTLISAVAAVVFLVLLLVKSGWPPLLPVSLLMILAGTVGNGIDRYTMGGVVDFLDFYYQNWHFPTFNLADSLITVGVVLLLIYLFFREEKDRKRFAREAKNQVRPL